MKNNNIRIINPISMSDFSEPPKEIQVLPFGTWEHPAYGKIKIKNKELSEFEKNFNNEIRRDLPINVEHKQTEGAVGWFKSVINKGKDGLWASVEWTKQGRQLLEEKVFKYFSPEFYSTYEDPETGKKYNNVLVGGALTNMPYFKGLKAIVFSELVPVNMKLELEDILKKEASELSEDEIKFLKENSEDLSDDDKKKFEEVLSEEPDEQDDGGDQDKDQDDKNDDDSDDHDDDDKDGKEVVMSEASLKVLNQKAEAGVKAMAELRRQNAEEVVKALTFSEDNKAGLILPKSKDKVVDFLLSLSEKQAEKFKEILVELPKANLFKEIGKDELGFEGDPNEQAIKLAEEKMAENDKLSFREAVDLVLAEKPDLADKIEQGE